jgi:hypothetical protein
MKAVTGQSEVLQLAEKLVGLCREHTSSVTVSKAALEVAGTVMSACDVRSFEEQSGCEPVPKQLT